MLGEVFGRGLAHEADSQPEQHALEGNRTSSASVGPAKNRPGWLLPKSSSACGIVTPRQSFPRQALRNRCLWRGVLTCVIISVR